MIILIPAYKPDNKLLEIISNILDRYTVSIVIVDDGSGPEFKEIFASARNMNCTVLTQKENLGKGRALKAGFQYILTHYDESTGVVIADADGQHIVEDIIKIAVALLDEPGKIVLGVREFTADVPLKSRIGNKASRCLFKMACGAEISDTQTGLRGFPATLLTWLIGVDGDRFEYETNMLIRALACGIRFREIGIKTVYQGTTSHYRAFADSIQIGRLLLKVWLLKTASSGK